MSSSETFSDNLDHTGRFAVAYVAIFIFFLIDLVSLSSVGAGLTNFPFFLIAVYYWSLYRPTLLPVWLVFTAGIITDIISGAPLGLNAALLVLVRFIIANQRRYLAGQTFIVVWLGFCLVLTLSLLFQWGIIALTALALFPMHDFGFVLLSGIAIFPLASAILHLTHKFLRPSHLRLRI